MSTRRFSPKHGLNPAVPKCYYCLEDKNEVILPGQINLRSGERDVEAPRNMVWDLRPCTNCEKLMEQGVILISIRDDEEPPVLPPAPTHRELTAQEKEDRMRVHMWNPCRTGGWVVLHDDAMRRIFNPPELVEQILQKRYTFVQHTVFQQLGLPLPEPKAEQLAGDENKTA
jgi:hypothetical protein